MKWVVRVLIGVVLAGFLLMVVVFRTSPESPDAVLVRSVVVTDQTVKLDCSLLNSSKMFKGNQYRVDGTDTYITVLTAYIPFWPLPDRPTGEFSVAAGSGSRRILLQGRGETRIVWEAPKPK